MRRAIPIAAPNRSPRVNYAVFSSGSIKDILTANGDRSVRPRRTARRWHKNHTDPVDSVPARNPRIVLNPLRMDNTSAMAVTWKFDRHDAGDRAGQHRRAGLRHPAGRNCATSSAVRLSLTNGRTVGSFSKGRNGRSAAIRRLFEVKSERYPLAVRIHVPVALLNDLNMKPAPARDIGRSRLAVLLAYLVARGLVPLPMRQAGSAGARAARSFRISSRPTTCAAAR
jgi:hypothetical protein